MVSMKKLSGISRSPGRLLKDSKLLFHFAKDVSRFKHAKHKHMVRTTVLMSHLVSLVGGLDPVPPPTGFRVFSTEPDLVEVLLSKDGPLPK